MEKLTRLDRIEIESDGTIALSFLKEIVDNGNALFGEPHRVRLEPTITVSERIRDVNAHLTQMNWPVVASDDLTKIKRCADAVRTPPVVAVFKQKMEAQQRLIDSKVVAKKAKRRSKK